MKNVLMAALGVGMLAGSISPLVAQEVTQDNATTESPDSTTGSLTSIEKLVDFLASSVIPDSGAPPLVGADIQAITDDSEIIVTPVSDLEGWPEEKEELNEAITAQGVPLTELHTAIQAHQHVVEALEAAGSAPEDVLAITTSGENVYTIYVNVASE